MTTDERGWPIGMFEGARCCAAVAQCRHTQVVDMYAEKWSYIPSGEFRVDGYCSVECRDFAELRAELAEARKLIADERVTELETLLREARTRFVSWNSNATIRHEDDKFVRAIDAALGGGR